MPYGGYYIAFTTLDQAKRHHIPLPPTAHAQFIVMEASGLAANAAVNKARGKSMWDDARRDSVLPNFIANKWNPKWLQWYLPGMGHDASGRKKIDWRW